MTKSKFSKEEYIKHPFFCPYCDSENLSVISASITEDNEKVEFTSKCDDCNSVVIDVFDLADIYFSCKIIDAKPGEKTEKKPKNDNQDDDKEYRMAGRIICITGYFEEYDKDGHKTGKKRFQVSHGIEEDTGNSVTLPNVHPENLGAVIDKNIGEWVIN